MADLPVTYRGMAYPWQCDVHGHLNVMWHTNMFDQASFVLTASLGIDQAYRDKHQGTVVTVQCVIAYKREVHAGHILAVRTRIAEVREKVIRLTHQLVEEGSGEVVALAEVTGVYMDTEARQARPFPEDIRARALAMGEEHGMDG